MSPRAPARQVGLPTFPPQGFALARSWGWYLHRAAGELWACRYEGPEDSGQPHKAIRYLPGSAADLPARTRQAFADAVAGLTAGVQ